MLANIPKTRYHEGSYPNGWKHQRLLYVIKGADIVKLKEIVQQFPVFHNFKCKLNVENRQAYTQLLNDITYDRSTFHLFCHYDQGCVISPLWPVVYFDRVTQRILDKFEGVYIHVLDVGYCREPSKALNAYPEGGHK